VDAAATKSVTSAICMFGVISYDPVLLIKAAARYAHFLIYVKLKSSDVNQMDYY
jgi:hypothetical protein